MSFQPPVLEFAGENKIGNASATTFRVGGAFVKPFFCESGKSSCCFNPRFWIFAVENKVRNSDTTSFRVHGAFVKAFFCENGKSACRFNPRFWILLVKTKSGKKPAPAICGGRHLAALTPMRGRQALPNVRRRCRYPRIPIRPHLPPEARACAAPPSSCPRSISQPFP